MHLSAPAPASFSETILPIVRGEDPPDAVMAGEGEADFGAVFAGLAETAAKGQEQAVSGHEGEMPATATAATAAGLGEEASLLAAFAAFLPTLPLTPTTMAQPSLAGVTGESVSGEGEGTLETSTTGQGAFVAPQGSSSWIGASPRAWGLTQAVTAQSEPGAVPLPTPAPVAPLPTNAAATASFTGVPGMPAEPAAASAQGSNVPVATTPVAEPPPPAQQAQLLATVIGDAAVKPDGQPRLRRAEGAPADAGTRTANFAAEPPAVPVSEMAPKTALEKNFLDIDGEVLAKQEVPLGTGVALREPTMTTSAPSTPSPAFVPVAAVSKDGALNAGLAGLTNTPVDVPASIERMAHRAVEAVVATVERGASQPAHSVNLKFSVQGADLMVRVALRADEVQVTFRTESAELRSALAQEWQMVRSRDPEGALQAVTPVFTAGDSGNPTSSQGGREGSQSFANLQAQADAHSQRQASRRPTDLPAGRAFGAPTAANSAAAPAVASRALSTEPNGAARLLHTFA